MPWEAILGGATGGVAVTIVLAMLFLKSVTEKVVQAAQMRFESALKRTEELQKAMLAMTSVIDTDLRANRIPVYAELWKTTGKLPQWPRNHEVTYLDLLDLTQHFRDWYFGCGGMYLSSTSREAYGKMQERLSTILKKNQEGKVNDPDYEAIRSCCSALRTELTRDLLSRREAPAVSGN